MFSFCNDREPVSVLKIVLVLLYRLIGFQKGKQADNSGWSLT